MPITPPTIRPTATATHAQESARMLLQLFDQRKRIDRPFDDEDDYTPADGVLDRGEFGIAKFDMVDKLQLSDGRITEAELAQAIGRLDAPTQERVLARTKETHARGTKLSMRFGGAFGGFATGGLALVGGLVLGGPIGLAAAGLGVLGIGVGFAMAIKTIFDGGKAAATLLKDVDAALGA